MYTFDLFVRLKILFLWIIVSWAIIPHLNLCLTCCKLDGLNYFTIYIKACSLSELDFHIQQIKNFALVNGRQCLLNAAIEMEDDTADIVSHQ
jgi:hypothetical protein